MVNLKCRVSDEIAKELKIEVAKQGTTTQAILYAAVEEFLSGKTKLSSPQPVGNQIESDYQQFLKYGDPAIVDIVKNLVDTHKISKKQKDKGQGRKTG